MKKKHAISTLHQQFKRTFSWEKAYVSSPIFQYLLQQLNMYILGADRSDLRIHREKKFNC